MADDTTIKAKQTMPLLVIGISLITIAIATSDSLETQTVAGIPGKFVTFGLYGLAIVLLVFAVVKAKASKAA
jgi:hypothetical protein